MARTTRSSAQNQEKDRQIEPASTSRPKIVSKKRKRTSVGDGEDHLTKLHRSGSVGVNGELNHDSVLDTDDTHTQLQLPSAGDVPITSEDAQKILGILEMTDTQGLLDRVFPLPSSSSESSGSKQKSPAASYSFRMLLKEAPNHPLRVLRSAIQQLLPITYHPRSRPLTPAAQQLRFCNIALSLLDQASSDSMPFPSNLDIALSAETNIDAGTDEDIKPTLSIESRHRQRRYALMQRLPGGDWWTSLNSDTPSSPDLKDLPTANAELVAILPTPSASEIEHTKIPNLGSYTPKKQSSTKTKLPAARHISCGTFLDYGLFASFAPTFEQEGREVGRAQLGEVYSLLDERKRKRKATPKVPSTVMVEVPEDSDVAMEDAQEITVDSAQSDVEKSLNGILSESQVASIKAALGSLELEAAVQELLERNRRALERLEVLQRKRLTTADSTSSTVEVGSEEWETAQGILDSLAILASFRPCSSQGKTTSLVPPPSVLRKLYRSLPLSPSSGWYGTLPPTRKTSLRDDSTVRIKSGANVPAATTTTAVTTTPNTNVATPTPAQPYPAYTYSTYAQQYRTPYVPYKSGQPAYYGAYQTTQGQTPASGQGQATAASYYPTQYAATGQQSYTYGGWYNYQPQISAATANAAASTSGRGTPQPSTAGRSTPISYASLVGTAQTVQSTPQRAVANTVLNKQYPTPAAWTTAVSTPGYVAPTLPAHLRTPATPGTPSVVSGGYQAPTYYGAYQATPPATR